MVAGVADVGWVDSSSSILAKDSGARIKCISGFAAKLDYQMVGTKDIASMAGLAGKRFGVATIGGGTFIIPRVMIEKAGGKPDDTQWVAIGNSAARVGALIADKIDATITTTSFVPRLLSYGRFAKFGDAGKELPDMVYCWEITSDKALAEKRALLAGFVAATSARRCAGQKPIPTRRWRSASRCCRTWRRTRSLSESDVSGAAFLERRRRDDQSAGRLHRRDAAQDRTDQQAVSRRGFPGAGVVAVMTGPVLWEVDPRGVATVTL